MSDLVKYKGSELLKRPIRGGTCQRTHQICDTMYLENSKIVMKNPPELRVTCQRKSLVPKGNLSVLCTLYNLKLHIARNLLETRVINTLAHPCYPINVNRFSWGFF